MANKLIPLAISYDFDGTLAPGNMQERDFIPQIGMNKEAFWKEVGAESKKHDACSVLIYMKMMLEKARASKVPVRKTDFEAFGKKLSFFKGVVAYQDGERKKDGWFKRINKYGKESGVDVKHYIVSSGIREMVAGTKIAEEFDQIYASSFCYDYHGIATWPALAVNYTTKTQFLFRINKGDLHVYEHEKINQHIPKNKRPVPFENMVFIGDGTTDVPCFRLIREQGGHAIAVYSPRKRGAKKRAEQFHNEGRVNFISTADYREGTHLDSLLKSIIDKIACDGRLTEHGKKG